MKIKNILILAILFSSFTLLAQNNKVKLEDTEEYKNSIELGQTGQNEVTFNLLTAVLGFPEISYERILASNMGYGFSGAVKLVNRTDRAQDYFLGYYRLYFGKKLASGTFLEANLGLINNQKQEYVFDYVCPGCYVNPTSTLTTSTTINIGTGFSIGYKFLTKNGLFGVINGGLGRNLGNPIFEVYPRVGVSLGKRF